MNFSTAAAEQSGDMRAINTVLLVDDSRAQLSLLSAMMRRWGYTFETAASGEEALEICRRAPVDLVISDWMMPGMDGLAFCRAFRGLPTDRYGYFILVTSKNEKQDIATGLDVGADEFLTKPVNPDELRARINAAERILLMQRRLNAQMEQLQKLYDKLDQDLIEAGKLQQSLVRDREVQRGPLALSFLLEPSGHVGGDLVGWFRAGEGDVGFFSLDVSGHGVPSALLTLRLAGMLSADNPEHNIALRRLEDGGVAPRPPEETAALLNEAILDGMDTDLYFTIALGVLNLATGQGRMVQAGHPAPLLRRAGGELAFLGEGGLPVGLIPGAQFTGFDFDLTPGDRLLLYSDGVTEAAAPDGALFGETRLSEHMQAHAQAAGQAYFVALQQALESFCQGGDPGDDVSGVLLEYGSNMA
ncbi:PP2C family protein-serine/threonine phosphatase [Pseudoruegeria aquimaris]|uniref:PP2C family protein-serine/threonine phosphatase n=1 Tax=Pseudoruegeria aquimaris TaxID=393663 RepID=UPI001FE8AF51|nr:SpoIIE family protein phosphatase [Pseudoruegeria aquimaris]